MEKGLLIILSGPSGVGKGTVRHELMKDKALHLFYSISMTTRPQRPGEIEGREYYFVSKEEFARNVANGNLLEHATFVGNCYGTPRDKVEQMREKGRNVLLEIEVNGAGQVIEKYHNDEPVSIFLVPPSFKALENRIRGRSTEPERAIEERLEKARKEIALKDHYQYVVLNDDVKRAVGEIRDIIKKEIALRSAK
jgi:guanylate kinase